MKKITLSVSVALLVSVGLIIMLTGDLIPQDCAIMEDDMEAEICAIPRMGGIHDPIYINGNIPGNDWSTCDIVTGDGTENNPYEIHDLIINASGGGLGISIQNSYVYAEIVNCTIQNGDYAGIQIRNSSLISISNCTVVNNFVGILLIDSFSNKISSNYCFTNYDGISLNMSNTNTISENNCSFNIRYGIFISSSHRNSIQTNNCSANGESGIQIVSSASNYLLDNFGQIFESRLQFSALIIPSLGAFFALGGVIFLFVNRKKPKLVSIQSKNPSKDKKSKIFGSVMIFLTNLVILISFYNILNLFLKSQAGYRVSVCGLADLSGFFDIPIMASIFIGLILSKNKSLNLKRDVVILGISAIISSICIITYQVNYEWIHALDRCTRIGVDNFSNIAKILNFQIILILLIYSFDLLEKYFSNKDPRKGYVTKR